MDAVLSAAAHALDTGDVLSALKRVALREDAAALALRGIALARLGDLARARELLRRAAHAFGSRQGLGRARCWLAEAEIALQLRELRGVEASLRRARRALSQQGDGANEQYADCLLVQTLLLQKRFDAAERALAALGPPRRPLLALRLQLLRTELGVRTLRVASANAALRRAGALAKKLGIGSLLREVSAWQATLAAPAARLRSGADSRTLSLRELERLLDSKNLWLVDVTRRSLRVAGSELSLATRPVLFALLRSLTESWPEATPRKSLIEGAFGVVRSNDSHRARLRVEIGRLRRALGAAGSIGATTDGFLLSPSGSRRALLLTPPHDGEQAELVALLSDGEAWSSSALALAVGRSQRSVQRALLGLLEAGQVLSEGRGRAQRWRPARAPFTTPMLLATDLVAG
ncbi:MAG: helix-turn-helix domain-containing protein [Polyangiaceae bacterium]